MNEKSLLCAFVLVLILGSTFVASATAGPPFGWAVAAPIETDNAGDASNPAIAGNDAGTAVAVWQQFDGTRWNIWANRYSVENGWETATRIESSPESASSPHVAVDPLGNALAVWEQFDGTRSNIWANRYVAGFGWSSPTMIETDNAGNAYSPHVGGDAGGGGMAVWQQHDGARWRAIANRYVAGVGWSTAVSLDPGVGGGIVGSAVAVDVGGNALGVWVSCCGPTNVWARHFTESTGWDPAALVETGDVGDAGEPQLAFDGAGNAMAVWRYWDGSARSAWSNRYVAGSGWGTPTPVETDPGDVSGLQVAVDSGGNATAIWGQWDGARTNIRANGYVAGAWGLPAPLESEPGEAGNPQVALDAQNRAIAVWQQFSGATVNIVGNRFTLATGWGTPTLVEFDNAGHAFVPEIAADGAGNAVAVWQQSDGTRYNIWANDYTRDNLPPDLGISSPTVSLTNNASVTVAGTSDAGASVTVDGTPVAVDASGGFSTQVTLPEGPHTFMIVAKDIEGNAATALRTITVDTTAPTVAIGSPATGTVTNRSTVHVSGITEPGSRLVVNGLVVSVGPGDAFAFDLALALGPNVITATATDAAGNAATAAVTVTLDVLAPSLMLISPTPMVTNDPNVLVEGTTESGATVTVDGTSVSVDANGRFTRLVSLPDGPHTFIVIATDVAGNFVSVSTTVTVDTSPPLLSLASPSDGSQSSVASVRVTGTAEPGVRLVVRGALAAIAADGSFSVNLPLAEGPNVITVTATDWAGNVATATVTVTYANPVPGLEQELNATRDALAAANANLAALGTQVVVLVSVLLAFVVVAVVQFVLYWRLRERIRGAGPASPPR